MRDRVVSPLWALLGLAAGLVTAVLPIKYPGMASWLVDALYWGGLAVAGLSFLAALALTFWPGTEQPMSGDQDSEAGDDNTVIGTAPKRMGSRNTIVNFSDANGNTILNRGGISIGAGASYDPTGTIIGSGAGGNLSKKLSDPNGD